MGTIKIIVERTTGSAMATENRTLKTSKGIIKRKPEEDYLFRRTKKGGFIRFFDGSYFPSSGGNLDFMNAQSTLTAADNIELIELILTKGFANAQSVQSLISAFAGDFETDGYFPFNVTVYAGANTYRPTDSLLDPLDSSFNEKWTAGGLKLEPDELANLDIFSEISGADLYLSGDYKNKITTVLDYDADAADFTPTAKMDILLVPKLFIFSGFSSYFDYSAGGASVTAESPKTRIVDLADLRYDRLNPNYRKFLGGSWSRASADDDASYFGAFESAVVGEAVGLGTGILIANSTAFPSPPTSPYSITGSEQPEYLYVGNNTFESAPEFRQVVAIIKQGENLFYVWNKFSSE